MCKDDDIQQIIKGLSSRKSLGSVDSEKLTRLFECTHLDVPEDLLDEERALVRIKASLRTLEIGPAARRSPGRMFRLALVSASAFVLILGVLAAYFYSSALFGPRERGLITAASGNVKIIRKGVFLDGKIRGSVYQGDVVQTGADSSIDISFENEVNVRILRDTRLNLDRAGFRERKDFLAFLDKGSALVYVKKVRQGDSIEFRTPDSRALVRGTVFAVNVAENATRYEVYSGKVQVAGRIEPGKYGLSGNMAEELNKSLGKAPVIVEGGSVCRVDVDPKLLSRLSGKDVRQASASAVRTSASPASKAVFILKEDAEDFIRYVKEGRTAKVQGTQPGEGPVYLAFDPSSQNVITITGRGMITAVRQNRQVWSLDVQSAVISVPVLHGGLLLLAGREGRILAVDVGTGRLLWSRGLIGSPAGEPGFAVDGGALYAGTDKKQLYKISMSGKVLWQSCFNAPLSATPAVGGPYVYVALSDGSVHGIDKENGSKLISARLPAGVAFIAASSQEFYAAVNGVIYVLDAGLDQGHFMVEVPGGIASPLFLEGDSLYLLSPGGDLVKVQSMRLVWRFASGAGSGQRPAFDSESVYIAGSRLHAVDKRTGISRQLESLPVLRSRNVALSGTSAFLCSETRGLLVLKK